MLPTVMAGSGFDDVDVDQVVLRLRHQAGALPVGGWTGTGPPARLDSSSGTYFASDSSSRAIFPFQVRRVQAVDAQRRPAARGRLLVLAGPLRGGPSGSRRSWLYSVVTSGMHTLQLLGARGS